MSRPRELSDQDLERVAAGKELRDGLARAIDSADQAARDINRTSRVVSDKVERLAKTLGVE